MSNHIHTPAENPGPKQSRLGELNTIEQTAHRLGCSKNTVRALIRKGDLPAVRIGPRMVRVRETDLEQILQPYDSGQAGSWAHLQ